MLNTRRPTRLMTYIQPYCGCHISFRLLSKVLGSTALCFPEKTSIKTADWSLQQWRSVSAKSLRLTVHAETLLNKEPTLILPVTHLRSFRSQCCMLHWHALEKQTACNATQNHAKFSLPLHAGVSLVIVRSFCRNPNLPCHVILILPYLDDNWFRHHRTTLSCFTDYHSA